MTPLQDEFEALMPEPTATVDADGFLVMLVEGYIPTHARLFTEDQLRAAMQSVAELAAKKEREVMLSADDMADLERLREVFDDGEGWDLPKDRMKRLAELGVVRWQGATRYSITSFGHYCLGDLKLPLPTIEEYNAKAYAEMLERNGIDAAAIRARDGKGAT
jgi:hypothetical protein